MALQPPHIPRFEVRPGQWQMSVGLLPLLFSACMFLLSSRIQALLSSPATLPAPCQEAFQGQEDSLGQASLSEMCVVGGGDRQQTNGQKWE